MAKITQKSMNAVLKVYRNQKTDVTLHMANPENPDEIMMEISVKNELSIEDKGNFIDRVVNACFDDGEFVPQYLDREATVQYMADFQADYLQKIGKDK